MLDDFLRTLTPLAERLARMPLDDPAELQRELNELLPLDDELIGSVRSAAEAGAEAGWLLPRQNGALRYGRVAKDLAGFSVDAVWMDGPGPRHRHPNGEIDLCFAASGEPRFDGNPEGWTVYGPGSAHVPTVSEGAMLILYFLPGGAIEWL